MDTNKLCESCHAPLAADAPRGLCPACLMKVAMATGTIGGAEKPGFTPPAIEELAQKFPQLEIIELIGRGGMGAVYKARQKELDRIVALKILPPGIGDDTAFAERFAREAKALARLNHPGIITIHDFGQADGLYFFVMEYVDGVNLRQLLANSRVSAREALAIVPQICDALQFAHDQGIVHRDIKPENILLDRRGRVKVADFGLAKIIEPESGRADMLVTSEIRATQQYGATGVMGTPNYMAPEQVAHPADVDHRADIYALGVVFYQMLTGELPGKQIEAPSKKVQIDVRLDEVVLRALEKKPELRYQHVSEVKTMVETIGQTTPPDNSQGEETRAQTLSQDAINQAEWNNPLNWTGPKWFSVYFSKRDTRAWVPKQIPSLGQTVNLGNPRGAFAFLAIMGAIFLLLALLPWIISKNHSIKSDYIGYTDFQNGDSIQITSVKRTKSQMTVKGRYNLVSADNALLALYITSTNGNGPKSESPKQRMQIAKGHGDFILTYPYRISGWPHVSMYSENKSIATIYFGTKAEALEEAKWHSRTLEQNAVQEIARLKLQHAEQEVKEAERKVSVGVMAKHELQKLVLFRDIAAAEVEGDNLEIAQL